MLINMVDPEILIKSSSSAISALRGDGANGGNRDSGPSSQEMLAAAVGNFLRIPRPFQYPFFHPQYNQYIYGQAAAAAAAAAQQQHAQQAAQQQGRKNGLENHVFNPKILIQDHKESRNSNNSQLKGELKLIALSLIVYMYHLYK